MSKIVVDVSQVLEKLDGSGPIKEIVARCPTCQRPEKESMWTVQRALITAIENQRQENIGLTVDVVMMRYILGQRIAAATSKRPLELTMDEATLLKDLIRNTFASVPIVAQVLLALDSTLAVVEEKSTA